VAFRIQTGGEETFKNSAGYIIRAFPDQKRMIYLPDESMVLFKSKGGMPKNL